MKGFDTGFFIRLLDGHAEARIIWEEVVDGAEPAAVSCLTVFELDRLALRGRLAREAARVIVDELPALLRVVWLDRDGARAPGTGRVAVARPARINGRRHHRRLPPARRRHDDLHCRRRSETMCR